jgi:hypothetical protein
MGGGGYPSPGTARDRMGSVPGYPSPALTPGSVPASSSSSEYPVPHHHTSFWSPITPPDGVDHLGHAAAVAAAAGGNGFERGSSLDMKNGAGDGPGGAGNRGPPTLVQMQVCCPLGHSSFKHLQSATFTTYNNRNA